MKILHYNYFYENIAPFLIFAQVRRQLARIYINCTYYIYIYINCTYILWQFSCICNGGGRYENKVGNEMEKLKEREMRRELIVAFNFIQSPEFV